MAVAPLHTARAFAASSSGLIFAGYLALLRRWRSVAGSLAVMGGVLSFWIVASEFRAWLLGMFVFLIQHFLLFMCHREISA
jgi:hypothetical protein